jgi:hypothetical protein
MAASIAASVLLGSERSGNRCAIASLLYAGYWFTVLGSWFLVGIAFALRAHCVGIALALRPHCQHLAPGWYGSKSINIESNRTHLAYGGASIRFAGRLRGMVWFSHSWLGQSWQINGRINRCAPWCRTTRGQAIAVRLHLCSLLVLGLPFLVPGSWLALLVHCVGIALALRSHCDRMVSALR